MKRRGIGLAVFCGAIVVIAIALSWPRAPLSLPAPPPPDASVLEVALVLDTGPNVVAQEADATPPNDELDHDPPKGTCRASIPEGASFARVTDRALAAAVVFGVDAKTGSFAAPSDAGVFRVRDCLGHGFTFGPASDDPDATPHIEATLAAPTEDSGASRGPFRVQRSRVLGRKMSVNVTVAVTEGYDETCHGFLALVRLDRDEIVVEATRIASGCRAGILAHLDGQLVVVEPEPPSNSGESAAVVDGDYALLRPHDGALVLLARIPAFRSWGNGAFGDPTPFASFGSEPVDVDGRALRVEERWRSEVVGDPDHEAHARTAKLVREYTYSGGKMTRSPSDDPFPIR